MTQNIISAQNKAIKSLKNAIDSFNDNDKIKTRVIPLAIPTGWGKTRIAIQAVLKQKTIKNNPPNIVIWPQKTSHISEEVWLRCTDWCNKRDKSKCPIKNCEWNEMPEIKYLESSKKGPKSKRHGRGAGNHSRKFNGTFYYVNNKFNGLHNELKKTRGPIIFIIDEWHTKKIIEKYDAYKKNDTDGGKEERFWRKLLLGKDNQRDLFVILISATPIGSTSYMDSICVQEDDNKYEQEISNALQLFNDLTNVGNQNREYNLYKIYPALITKEERKLSKLKQNEKKFSYNNRTSEWVREYIRLSKKAYVNSDLNPASLVYPLESLFHSGATKKMIIDHFRSLKNYFKSGCKKQIETLKLRTTKELLNHYANKKFVIFCHYIAVAHSLNNYLSKDPNYKDCCYFLQGDVKVNDHKFKSFNKNDGKIRILIVTDEHSQGISLHKSAAWLIHFELSWNPIRIIQRFGRVWRIDQTKRLTSPVTFYVPHSFSSEEEQIARLERRWSVLKNLPNNENTFVNLAPISFEIALGIRCTPDVRNTHH